MKHIFSMLLAAILLFALTGCAEQSDPATPTLPQEAPGQNPTVTDNPALLVMERIWACFKGAKDDYVGGSGGDYRTAEPWQVALSDTDFLQGALFLSEKQCQAVKGAASLLHSLNTNNLTAGAVALEEGADYEAFAQEVKERILQNQWVCGRPGGLRIVKVETCLLILYGSGSYSGGFVKALEEAYPDAQVLCRESI